MERSEKDKKPKRKVVVFNLKNTVFHFVPAEDSSRNGGIWMFDSMMRRMEEKKSIQKPKKLQTIPGQNGLFLA